MVAIKTPTVKFLRESLKKLREEREKPESIKSTIYIVEAHNIFTSLCLFMQETENKESTIG